MDIKSYTQNANIVKTMPRSLFIRNDCITNLKSSLLRHGFPSQKLLAEDLGLSQSTVSNFLNGRPVDYINFLEICRVLGQEWRDIADFSSEEKEPDQDVTKPTYIVISDRSNHSLGSQLEKGLTIQGLNVFLVSKHTEINGYLKQADYLLLLLAVESIFNELVISELQQAKDLHHNQPLKPIILPVFINFSFDYILPFDLWGYLRGVTVWNWLDDYQINDLITELLPVFKEHRQSLPQNHKFTIDVTQKNSASDVNIPPLSSAIPEVTGGQIELESRFYIQRFPIEQRCLETISQPGALIRIKAPRQMGKSSLLARILAAAEKQGDRTVCLSFQLANQRIFQNSDAFLQWFCASISLELELFNSEQLSKYWQLAEMIGSNQCCKAYFEQYLLPQINAPLTLGLDEVDRVFENPEIADDFFGLLRSLHEEGKRRDIWKNFRLIVVHSTEVYIPLDVNKSPFNVGLPIELPEFNIEQVQELALRHGLNLLKIELEKMIEIVGGHPYLLRLAMYHLANKDVKFDELINMGINANGIYIDHLKRHLWNLQKYPELLTAMQTVVMSDEPIKLPSEYGFKLNSMGLVKLIGNKAFSRCKLYTKFFQEIG